MDLLADGKDGKKISLHVDPFKKENVDEIDIHMTHGMLSPHAPYWWATVSFKAGKTTGKHRFGDYKIDEYEKMITEIQEFINSL